MRRAFPWIVWLLVAAYIAGFADRGWNPGDEGQLGQAAERVLQGQVPHRDFDECYTGGLTFLHALAFRLLGVKLGSLRVVLAAFFLALIPATYAIAARVATPLAAGWIFLACSVWSVPQYIASMPSWYNLLFALAGALCLLRWLDTRRARWLFLAGVAGGLSIIVKVIGLYFVGAALLFLAYEEQLRASARDDWRGASSAVFRSAKVLALVAFVAALFSIVRRHAGPMEIYLFVAPGAAIAALIAWSEVRSGQGALGDRARAMLARLLPFGAGVAAPILPFVLYFLHEGALGDLLTGTFVAPQRRLDLAVPWLALPPVSTIWVAAPYALLLLLGDRVAWTPMRRTVALIAIFAFSAFVHEDPCDLHGRTWYGLLAAPPLVVAAGCLGVIRQSRAGATAAGPDARAATVLLLSLAALLPLVQFPSCNWKYSCYAAPASILAWFYVAQARSRAERPLHASLLLAFVVFGILEVIRPVVLLSRPILQLSPDAQERAGLVVDEWSWRLYREVAREVQRLSPPGAFIYAAPDCPEVYYLSDRPNPTRTFYEFLSAEAQTPASLARMLSGKGVKVVVINQAPAFSTPMDPALLAVLRRDFADEEQLGPFEVRWRP